MKRYVSGDECEQKHERADSKAVKHGHYRLHLIAENSAKQKIETGIKDRAEQIEKQKPAGTDAERTRERRRNNAKAGDEFGEGDNGHSVAGETAFSLLDAGVVKQSDAAEEVEDAGATSAANIEPRGIGDEAGENG